MKKQRFRRCVAALLSGLLFASVLPLSAFAANTEGNDTTRETTGSPDATEQIYADAALEELRIGEKVTLSDDGVIGVPVGLDVYYDSTKGTATAGYGSDGATPVILYVVNANVTRTGTESDSTILRRMLSRGWIVLLADYGNYTAAQGEKLDYSVQSLRARMAAGEFFGDKNVFADGTYHENFIVPAGDDLLYRQVYFSLDKHGTDGTAEKIVEVWNADFRKYKKDIIVKWVRENGERKEVQNGFDGSSPVWYADAAGKTEDTENGIYTKIAYTKAETIFDCTKADGSPLDYDLYMHIVYPTAPTENVPVMAQMSSGEHLVSTIAKADRPQLNAFLFSGYAGAMFDYPYVPMGRSEAYGYFDGSSGTKSVTGDNMTYATYTYNAAQSATAAMRYIRYLSLAEAGTYRFDRDAVGVFGISKSSWMTFLGASCLREGLIGAEDGKSDAEISAIVDEKVRTLYQTMYLSDHHGETRYDNGKTGDETREGFTFRGGERQPWASYEGEEISSGAEFIYSSCGATIERFDEGFSPMFVSVNLQDQYNTGYGRQNLLVNLCRENDVPLAWFEIDIGHTYANGLDRNFGVNTYEAFVRFANYYLKHTPVGVLYTDPQSGAAGLTPTDGITVKFAGSVEESELSKAAVTAEGGRVVSGTWTSRYGKTEWTFRPSDLSGARKLTLTLPADLRGTNGKEMGEAYTATFSIDAESTVSLSSESKTLNGGESTFYALTVPAFATGYDSLKLRLRVTNDAANLLSVYTASSATDEEGSLLGTVRVNGAGFYEFDVTDTVAGHTEGENLFFRVTAKETAGEVPVTAESLESSLGAFTRTGYTSASFGEIEGESALRLTVLKNTGKYEGGHEFYEAQEALRHKTLIKNGQKLDASDLGRRFRIRVRIYDTESRDIFFTMNALTSSATKTFDYERLYLGERTAAGAWKEFVIPYTVYEPAYGTAGLAAKTFALRINSTGDTEAPIWFRDFSVTEYFTETAIADASFVFCKEGNGVYTPAAEGAPFAVGDTYYESLSDALLAAGDGGTVSVRRNLTLTAADAVLLPAAKVSLDLSGYRLTALGATSPFLYPSDGGNAAGFTLKNGSVFLSDAPLFGYRSNTVSGTSSYETNLENVYIGLQSNALATELFVKTDLSGSGSVTQNINLTDCELRIRLGDARHAGLTLFGRSLMPNRVNYTLAGCEITLDSVRSLTVGDSLITLADAEKASTLRVAESLTSLPTFRLLLSDGAYGFFAASGTEDGYRVCLASHASETSDYGAIPDSYLDADAYPFLLFSGGVCIGAADSWQSATREVQSRLTVGALRGGEIQILLRRDFVHDADSEKFTTMGGTLTLDLGGHSMTRVNTLFECAVPASGAYASAFTVKNGTLLAKRGHFVAFEMLSSSDLSTSLNFTDVTFALAEGVEKTGTQYLLARTWNGAGTGTHSVALTLTDCTIDLTGATAGSAPFEGTLHFSSCERSNVRVDMTVLGGRILATSFAKLNLLNGDNADTAFFGRGGEGSYLTLTADESFTLPYFAFETEDGGMTFGAPVSADGKTTYSFVADPLFTEYGKIPAAYADPASYPYLLFMDGACIGGGTTYRDAFTKAKAALDASPGHTVTMLLRTDNRVTAGPLEKFIYLNGTLHLDLGGHTLATTATLFEGEIDSGYNGSYTTTLLVENGTISMERNGIIAFKSVGTTDKTSKIVIRDVAFETTKTSGNLLTNNWSDGKGSAVHTVTMELCDCTYNLSDATGNMYLVAAQTETTALDLTVAGGTLIGDATKLSFSLSAEDTVRFTAGKDGKLLGVGSSVTTEYGVIPSTYADAEAYPYAIFMDGVFRSAKTTYASAFSQVYSLLTNSANPGKCVTVLLRTDNTVTGGPNKWAYLNGTFRLDLGGHTLTTTVNLFEGAIPEDYTGDFETSLFVTNGNIHIKRQSILAFESKGETAKTSRVTFENVTFTTTQTSGNILSVNWNTGTAVHTVDLTFNDCTFDLSGATGSVTLLNFGQANTQANITFSGGKIIGKASLLNIAGKTAKDTISFISGSDGYTVLLQPAGADAPTLVFPTPSGSAKFARDGETADGMTIWRLGLGTAYGVIPPDAMSAASYPYVLFLDGSFVAGASSWSRVTALAREILDAHPGGTLNVLLRKDRRETGGATYLCYMNGTLMLDLGGFMLTAGATLFEGAIHVDYNGNFDTALIVKNGTVLAERHIMAFECKNNTQKKLSVLFEKVTFSFSKDTEDIYLISQNWGGAGEIFLSMTFRDCDFDFSGATAGSVIPTTKKTVIKVSQSNCRADIRIEGGKVRGSLENITFLVTDATDTVRIAKGEDGTYPSLNAISESSEGTTPSRAYPSDMTGDIRTLPYLVVDSSDGIYVYLHILGMAGKSRLTLPVAADGSNFVSAVLLGYDGSTTALKLTKLASGYEILLPDGVSFGSSDTVLRLERGTKFPDFRVKGNLTLTSDFRYNLYLPVCDALTAAELDGVMLSLSTLERVTIGGVEYYRLTMQIAAKEGADVFRLTVTLDDGTVSGTKTYLVSIPKYAKRILDGEDETPKTLVRDILSYIDAAMTYFGISDAGKKASITDLIGETYNGMLGEENLPTAEETVPGLYSVRLNLGATPSFRFYPKDGVDFASFTFERSEGILSVQTITDEEGRQCIEVTTYAYAMLNSVRYTFKDGESTQNGTFNLSAYYASKNISQETKVLTLHLAKYAFSAAKYREDIGE